MSAPRNVYRLEIAARAELGDALATATGARLAAALGRAPAGLRTRKVYLLDCSSDAAGGDDRVTPGEAAQVLAALTDPVAEVGAVGALPDDLGAPAGAGAPWLLTIGFRPGVTDSVATSVKRAAEDCLGRPIAGQVHSATMYVLWGLDAAEVERAARELHNPLIERAVVERAPRAKDDEPPRAGGAHAPVIATVPLRAADDAELLRISQRGLLALSLLEMQAIRSHFGAIGRDPTDAELECLAQTWSEHCKHKIFAAPIDYTDPEGQTRAIERGLFRTYIRGATEAVAAARAADGVDGDAPFLVSVFHDNAGVVRFTDADHLVYKVETHNSPSALDPYGGAMTGIVGVNRDSLGTGLGAELLTNVWGYCLGEPEFSGQLPAGLMHPRRIRDGVHRGVIDGGNQSGIPYSRGFELFDARYAGKPLVYCGTVAVMPVRSAGRPGHEKNVRPGDAIVMLGGRIGKDGIHGATFSSVELDESSPVQAVQIGDPITQKMMADFLGEARERGLYSGLTDNGAGGLSSSIGEMATMTGGATIDLALAPLKYPGLMPWEILISEAQERMTLAVPQDSLEEFLALARRREVEATVLGTFDASGRLRATFGEQVAVDLDLEFLHEGTPRARMRARWSPPRRDDSPADAVLAVVGETRLTEAPGCLGHDLLDMLERPNLRSNEHIARRYDHEVKGLSVVKPWVGVREDVPSTATVMRARHGRREGLVLAEGIHPYYSDVDTDAMARACVDEAVRRALCAGARYDRLSALDNFCWPDPVQSDKTPDGEHKLAQLVRCCEGLRAACEAFGVPLISGKDSMKNDANLGGIKISIPPTLLVSVMGQMEDVGRALDLTPVAPGDLLFVLGPTRSHLGAGEFARHHGLTLGAVPTTDLPAHARRYRAFAAARDAGLVRSAHVVGRGGLAVALAHLTLAGELGVEVNLGPWLSAQGPADMSLTPAEALFSESTGRIVLTCKPAAAGELRARLPELFELGAIAAGRPGGWLRVRRGDQRLIEVDGAALRARFRRDWPEVQEEASR